MNDRDPLLDGLQGALLLSAFAVASLPAPWSPFDGAPDTASLGAGLAAVLALPALLLAATRVALGARPGIALGYPLLVGVTAFAAWRSGAATDTFQAGHALLALVAATGYVAAGATLGDQGRRVVQRGFPFVTLVLLGSTVLERELSGSLGNTGDLSEAALAGAILGAGAFLNATGLIAFVGFAALLSYALYVGLVPVYAGTLGLGTAAVFALGASALGRAGGEAGRQSAARRARILLVAVLVAVVTAGIAGSVRRVPADEEIARATEADAAPNAATPDPSTAPEPADAPDDPLIPPGAPLETGGFEFRRLTWARIPALLRDHGSLGVGPGQFQAAFPLYRDPAEIELSSHGRREPTPVEVEHAHSEPLTALAEYGWVGGGAFVLFLLLVAVRAAVSIASEDTTRRDFGTAALALVAVSLVNAPLLYGPASPIAAFVVFGVVLASGRPEEGTRPVVDLAALAIPAIALLLLVPRAKGYIDHGRALAEVPTARVVLADGREQLDPDRLNRILDVALEARPDSPTALEKKAQLLYVAGGPTDERAALLDRLLALRPASISALVNAGNLEARRGRLDAAAHHFDAAFEVDPGYPVLLENRLRLAMDLRDPVRVREAIRLLRERGRATTELLGTNAREMLLGGRVETAAPLVEAYRAAAGLEPLGELDANSLNTAAEEARRAGDELFEDAYRAAAKMALALFQLEGADAAQAPFTARLAFQKARDAGVDTGATRLRYAAALAARGKPEQAREILGEAPLRPVDRRALTEVERAALEAGGVHLGETIGPDTND